MPFLIRTFPSVHSHNSSIYVKGKWPSELNGNCLIRSASQNTITRIHCTDDTGSAFTNYAYTARCIQFDEQNHSDTGNKVRYHSVRAETRRTFSILSMFPLFQIVSLPTLLHVVLVLIFLHRSILSTTLTGCYLSSYGYCRE